MDYELREIEKVLNSNAILTIDVSSNVTIKSIEDYRGTIESEYIRLIDTFQNYIYSDKTKENIMFYLNRYGKRMVDLQKEVKCSLKKEMKSLLLEGFDVDSYQIFRNGQYLYKCLTRLLDLIYNTHSYLLKDSEVLAYSSLSEGFKTLNIEDIRGYFLLFRLGKLGLDLTKINNSDNIESYPKVITVNGFSISFTQEDFDGEIDRLLENDFEDATLEKNNRRNTSILYERKNALTLSREIINLVNGLALNKKIRTNEFTLFTKNIRQIIEPKMANWEKEIENSLLQLGYFPERVIRHLKANFNEDLSLLDDNNRLEFLNSNLNRFKELESNSSNYKLMYSEAHEIIGDPQRVMIEFLEDKINNIGTLPEKQSEIKPLQKIDVEKIDVYELAYLLKMLNGKKVPTQKDLLHNLSIALNIELVASKNRTDELLNKKGEDTLSYRLFEIFSEESNKKLKTNK